MLPLPLKFSFKKFRRELSPSARSDLDRLALRLKLLKGPKVIGGDYLTGFTNVLRCAAPTFSREECKALAFYALCARCDSSVWLSLNPLASEIQSGIQSSQSSSSAELMSATQQMQEMQMSFNLQYLMLQENLQNDSREYTCLSNVMKARYATMKGILSNLR
jgi:hypothetical protein